MGLLHVAAAKIAGHLQSRDTGDHPICAELDQECARQHAALDVVCHRLAEGRPLQPEEAVRAMAPLDLYQSAEGRMHWGEQWVYPSADVLAYLSNLSLRPELPVRKWEGHLQVLLEGDGPRLPVAIPLTSLPWIEPRGQTRKLKPAAAALGRPPRKWEQVYLQQFKEPHPDLEQRAWRMQVSAEVAVEEVLTNLVIVPRKQRFPVAQEDQQTAWQWVLHIIWEGARRLGEDDSQRRAKEIAGEVFQSLVERFDLPATSWALQGYIKATARGLVLKAYPSLQSHEPWIDPASGEQAFPDAWVAQAYDVSPRKVARWRAAQDIRTRGLSEEQRLVFQQEQEEKQVRKRLRRMEKEHGMSTDTIKKLFQRKKKPDGTLDLRAIEAHIKRYGSKAATEDMMSLKEQIAMLEGLLSEPGLGSQEREEVLDKLRQLRQP